MPFVPQDQPPRPDPLSDKGLEEWYEEKKKARIEKADRSRKQSGLWFGAIVFALLVSISGIGLWLDGSSSTPEPSPSPSVAVLPPALSPSPTPVASPETLTQDTLEGAQAAQIEFVLNSDFVGANALLNTLRARFPQCAFGVAAAEGKTEKEVLKQIRGYKSTARDVAPNGKPIFSVVIAQTEDGYSGYILGASC